MRIAITGGTGSLGSELIAQLAHEGADRIVTVTRDEHRRGALQERYADHPGVKVYAGDVRDETRLRDVFDGCEVVVHAAAPCPVEFEQPSRSPPGLLQGQEPREMLLTNVIGTANVLSAARHARVRKVLFISSDKAVHANNIYGTSKALAEALVLSENARCFAEGMRCSVIRYGNVLGSNGSVLKLWASLAERGQSLPVSSTKMTRFWLTIETAAAYVRRAVNDMRGGEVLVPRIKAAPLVRLLEAVAPGAETRELGIRPGGEKLHEVLLSEDELRRVLVKNQWLVVPPVDGPELWDRSPWLGGRPGSGFSYSSDTWPEQWSVEELREALGRSAFKEKVA